MKKCTTWCALALLLSSLPALAVDLPAERLTVDFIKEVKGNKDSAGAARLWRQFYPSVTDQVEAIWKKYGPGRGMTPEEHECLRQKATELDVENAADFMSSDYRTFVGEVLHRLRKQDGERCPKGNAGLHAFRAYARDSASKLGSQRTLLERALEDGLSAAREMAGRPLTPGEVAAITTALIFSAPVWALP